MLSLKEIEDIMDERGFSPFAYLGDNMIHFVSKKLYNPIPVTNRHKNTPIFNVIVNRENEEFECIYHIEKSINTIQTPKCGSVMKDDHFDRIVIPFEQQIRWMARLSS